MRRLVHRPAAMLVRSVLLASVLVVLVAAPASAQNPRISHHQKHLWHYWIAPVVLGSGVLLVLALAVGYYVRVVRGK